MERTSRRMRPKMLKMMMAFPPQQWARLEAESERLGISVQELLRRIVDQVHPPPQEEPKP